MIRVHELGFDFGKLTAFALVDPMRGFYEQFDAKATWERFARAPVRALVQAVRDFFAVEQR